MGFSLSGNIYMSEIKYNYNGRAFWVTIKFSGKWNSLLTLVVYIPELENTKDICVATGQAWSGPPRVKLTLQMYK